MEPDAQVPKAEVPEPAAPSPEELQAQLEVLLWLRSCTEI